MIVVKVGGSLFDAPALGPALRAYLATLAPKEILLVAGGGPVADAVRALDRTHTLGEEAAHWLALRAIGVTKALLEQFLGEPRGLPPRSSSLQKAKDRGDKPRGSPSLVHILDCFAFALEDEARDGALPHTWAVTTDSIAARAAVVFRAERLVLLKSVDVPPGTPWEAAAANGWVDAHFPQIAATFACPIEFVNFRRLLPWG